MIVTIAVSYLTMTNVCVFSKTTPLCFARVVSFVRHHLYDICKHKTPLETLHIAISVIANQQDGIST